MEAAIVVPAILILIGLVGIVIPVLPGLILVVAGVFVWALETQTPLGWSIFALAVVLYLAGLALQYAIPGRHLRAAGVRTSTLVLAVLLGVVGFFVVPVVGGPLGFVLGIYLVEAGHSRNGAEAWRSTRAALKAVLLSMGIELLAGLAITTTWVVGVVASA
jgi:uncharacterized protein YqgC (DUF456 family)